MTTRSSIMIDIDDPKVENVAEVLSNKTCKKILAVLAEKEMAVNDIAKKLETPLNTTSYNIKKLVDAGLVERVNKVFWSAKGKKMEIYKVANKRIVIMPKIGVRGVVPALIVAVLGAIGIKIWSESYMIRTGSELEKSMATIGEKAAEAGGQAFDSGVYGTLFNAPDVWTWYLLGALTVLLVILLWNWRRK